MKTILYYTSNRENPDFEKRVQQNLLENCGDLPIVSVSQKPLFLGKNICVGDVGHSYFNEFRQILIGVKEIQTEYVVFAEADFIYPKEYFEFTPPSGDLWRYDNVWLVFRRSPSAYRKAYSNGAQIARREWLIDTLEKYFEGQPEWSDKQVDKADYNGAMNRWFSGPPCVSFRTGSGMSVKATYNPEPHESLEYWGGVRDLKAKFL